MVLLFLFFVAFQIPSFLPYYEYTVLPSTVGNGWAA